MTLGIGGTSMLFSPQKEGDIFEGTLLQQTTWLLGVIKIELLH